MLFICVQSDLHCCGNTKLLRCKMPFGWYFISDGFAVTLHPDTFSHFTNCELKGKSMVVTNKTEQGRQYKEYTREATGNKAERSAQLLVLGRAKRQSRALVRIAQFFDKRSDKSITTTRLEGSLGAAFCIYSSQSISWKRENRLPSRSICSKNIFSGRTQYLRSP